MSCAGRASSNSPRAIPRSASISGRPQRATRPRWPELLYGPSLARIFHTLREIFFFAERPEVRTEVRSHLGAPLTTPVNFDSSAGGGDFLPLRRGAGARRTEFCHSVHGEPDPRARRKSRRRLRLRERGASLVALCGAKSGATSGGSERGQTRWEQFDAGKSWRSVEACSPTRLQVCRSLCYPTGGRRWPCRRCGRGAM